MEPTDPHLLHCRRILYLWASRKSIVVSNLPACKLGLRQAPAGLAPSERHGPLASVPWSATCRWPHVWGQAGVWVGWEGGTYREGTPGSWWAWAFENRFSYWLGPSLCLHSVGRVLWSWIQRRSNAIGAGAQGQRVLEGPCSWVSFWGVQEGPRVKQGCPLSAWGYLLPHLSLTYWVGLFHIPLSPLLQSASSPGQGLSLVPPTSSPEPQVNCLQETWWTSLWACPTPAFLSKPWLLWVYSPCVPGSPSCPPTPGLVNSSLSLSLSSTLQPPWRHECESPATGLPDLRQRADWFLLSQDWSTSGPRTRVA